MDTSSAPRARATISAWLWRAGSGLLIGVCLTSSPSFARDAGNKVRAPTYRVLGRIHKMMDEERYAEALAKIDDFASRVQRFPFERALLHQTRAYVLLSQERYAEAIPALEAALGEGVLSPEATVDLRFNLAQILIHVGRAQDAVGGLESWFSEPEAEPPPDAYALAGRAYYRLEAYDDACRYLQRALAEAREPQESWQQLLLATYYETQRYEPALDLLRTMIGQHPAKRAYWLELGKVALQLQRDELALSALELAEDAGVLDASDLVMLARLNLSSKAPDRAGRLLSQALSAGRIEAAAEHMELLADSWVLAREYEAALGALETAAGIDPQRKAELDLRRSELLGHVDRWSDVIPALESPLRAADPKVLARAHLLLGISLYYRGDYAASLPAFHRAEAHESTRQQARDWSEVARQRMRSQ